jgi:signal transduction histidine kinase
MTANPYDTRDDSPQYYWGNSNSNSKTFDMPAFHCRDEKCTDVRITVSIVATDVYLTVSDRGKGFDSELSSGDRAVGEDSTGLGPILVRGLMDEVTVRSSADGTTVRLAKHLRASAPGG